MIPVPNINDLNLTFGDISHLPSMVDIPDAFKRHDGTKWNNLVNTWFFKGLDKETLDKLKPKDGVDKNKALKAVASILRSFEPKHEHKEAGCALLMSNWFEDLE